VQLTAIFVEPALTDVSDTHLPAGDPVTGHDDVALPAIVLNRRFPSEKAKLAEAAPRYDLGARLRALVCEKHNIHVLK